MYRLVRWGVGFRGISSFCSPGLYQSGMLRICWGNPCAGVKTLIRVPSVVNMGDGSIFNQFMGGRGLPQSVSVGSVPGNQWRYSPKYICM